MSNKILASFAAHLARKLIRATGKRCRDLSFDKKEDIKKNSLLVGIHQAYLSSHSVPPTPDVFLKVVLSDDYKHAEEYLDYMMSKIGQPVYDSNLSFSEKKSILKNSRDHVEKHISEINDAIPVGFGRYMKYKDIESKEDIFLQFDATLSSDKDLERILELLSDMGLNFIIKIPGTEKLIYPIVSDILIDLVSVDIAMYKDRNILKELSREDVYKTLEESEEEDPILQANFKEKLKLRKNLGLRRSISFLVEDQFRQLDSGISEVNLNITKNKYRRLFQYIVYDYQGNHKNSPSFLRDEYRDFFESFPSRAFFLENTKMVTGQIEPDAEDIPKASGSESARKIETVEQQKKEHVTGPKSYKLLNPFSWVRLFFKTSG